MSILFCPHPRRRVLLLIRGFANKLSKLPCNILTFCLCRIVKPRAVVFSQAKISTAKYGGYDNACVINCPISTPRYVAVVITYLWFIAFCTAFISCVRSKIFSAYNFLMLCALKSILRASATSLSRLWYVMRL